MTKAVVILPKKPVFDAKKMRGVITSTLNAQAKAIKVDFDVTTQTWNHRPSFKIASPSEFVREISTDSDIYRYVSKGTKVRYAVMTNPFVAKTVPLSIRSRKGRGGVLFVSKKRRMPGIKARQFEIVIAKKWQAQIGVTFQRAIDSATS